MHTKFSKIEQQLELRRKKNEYQELGVPIEAAQGQWYGEGRIQKSQTSREDGVVEQ